MTERWNSNVALDSFRRWPTAFSDPFARRKLTVVTTNVSSLACVAIVFSPRMKLDETATEGIGTRITHEGHERRHRRQKDQSFLTSPCWWMHCLSHARSTSTRNFCGSPKFKNFNFAFSCLKRRFSFDSSTFFIVLLLVVWFWWMPRVYRPVFTCNKSKFWVFCFRSLSL